MLVEPEMFQALQYSNVLLLPSVVILGWPFEVKVKVEPLLILK
jgi:hypothetical protein